MGGTTSFPKEPDFPATILFRWFNWRISGISRARTTSIQERCAFFFCVPMNILPAKHRVSCEFHNTSFAREMLRGFMGST